MGMTILQAKQRLHEKWMQLTKDGTDEEMMQAISIVDTVLGNYDEALKADLVAMLEELDLQIDELYFPQTYPKYMEGRSDCLEEIKELIQQKINSLKEAHNDREKDI
jgi:hypothetical protein